MPEVNRSSSGRKLLGRPWWQGVGALLAAGALVVSLASMNSCDKSQPATTPPGSSVQVNNGDGNCVFQGGSSNSCEIGNRPTAVAQITSKVAFFNAVPRMALAGPIDSTARDLIRQYPSQDLSKLEAHLRAAGAFYVGSFEIQVAIQTKSDLPVRITDVRPTDIRRSNSISSTLILFPGGGDTDPYRMVFDMNDPTPRAKETEDSDKPGTLYFANHTLFATNNEDVVLSIKVVMGSGSGQFAIAAEYSIGGEVKQLVITDEGRPFRLSAFNCAPGSAFARYSTVWGETPGSNGAQMDELSDPAHQWSCSTG